MRIEKLWEYNEAIDNKIKKLYYNDETINNSLHSILHIYKTKS